MGRRGQPIQIGAATDITWWARGRFRVPRWPGPQCYSATLRWSSPVPERDASHERPYAEGTAPTRCSGARVGSGAEMQRSLPRCSSSSPSNPPINIRVAETPPRGHDHLVRPPPPVGGRTLFIAAPIRLFEPPDACAGARGMARAGSARPAGPGRPARSRCRRPGSGPSRRRRGPAGCWARPRTRPATAPRRTTGPGQARDQAEGAQRGRDQQRAPAGPRWGRAGGHAGEHEGAQPFRCWGLRTAGGAKFGSTFRTGCGPSRPRFALHDRQAVVDPCCICVLRCPCPVRSCPTSRAPARLTFVPPCPCGRHHHFPSRRGRLTRSGGVDPGRHLRIDRGTTGLDRSGGPAGPAGAAG